jgi:hypothetical protein
VYELGGAATKFIHYVNNQRRMRYVRSRTLLVLEASKAVGRQAMSWTYRVRKQRINDTEVGYGLVEVMVH